MWKTLRRDLGLEVVQVEEALVEPIEQLVAPDSSS
jgi:hypothetical protein